MQVQFALFVREGCCCRQCCCLLLSSPYNRVSQSGALRAESRDLGERIVTRQGDRNICMQRAQMKNFWLARVTGHRFYDGVTV
jgi:hypothetical protein